MNLAMPGLGSLAAGRKVGYAQMTVALIGMAMTMAFGVNFFFWYLGNYSKLQADPYDPLAGLAEIWRVARWPLLGFAVFGLAWVWGLLSGLIIVSSVGRGDAERR